MMPIKKNHAIISFSPHSQHEQKARMESVSKADTISVIIIICFFFVFVARKITIENEIDSNLFNFCYNLVKFRRNQKLKAVAAWN